jgi:hypothetical protein
VFYGTTSFGTNTFVSSGGSDIFITKISSTGAYLRALKAGATSDDYGYAIAADSGGNTYVAGYFQ